MDKHDIKLEYGRHFSDYLKKSKYNKTEFGKLIGVGYPSQSVNNWLKRGVPTAYASKAAELLGCTPSEISDVMPVSNESDALILKERKEIILKQFESLLNNIEDENNLDYLSSQMELFKKFVTKN